MHFVFLRSLLAFRGGVTRRFGLECDGKVIRGMRVECLRTSTKTVRVNGEEQEQESFSLLRNVHL
jgi:hypothetical protein